MDQDWFGPHVGPDAAVSTYMMAPPQGMTNPPQSSKVKRMLHDELNENGIRFGHEKWPPPLPEMSWLEKEEEHVMTSKAPSRSRLPWPTHSTLSLEEQRSGRFVSVEKKPSSIARKWAKSLDSSSPIGIAIAKRSASAPGLPNLKDKPKSEKAEPSPKAAPPKSSVTGLVPALTRIRLAAGRSRKPLPQVFNSLDPEGRGFVHHDDFIKALRGLRCSLTPEEHQLLAAEFAHKEQTSWICYAHFLKRLTPLKVDAIQSPTKRSVTSGASRTNSMDTADLGDDSVYNSESSRRGSVLTKAAKLAQADVRQSSKGPAAQGEEPFSRRPSSTPLKDKELGRQETKSTPTQAGGNFTEFAGSKLKEFLPDEKELRNDIACLRSMGRLHKAAVADRFRFGADLTAAGSMVLAGAGAAPNPPGRWGSDASELNKFHNGAMRKVDPSGLDEIKEPQKRRKKKADEDELKLSDSGLFFARYPPDKALKLLKAMKRQHFPDPEEEKTVTQSGVTLSAEQQNAASFLAGLKIS